MPEDMIYPRRGIHDRRTLQNEEYDQDELSPEFSQDSMTDSDGEHVERAIRKGREQCKINRTVSLSPQRLTQIKPEIKPNISNTIPRAKTFWTTWKILSAILVLIAFYYQFKDNNNKTCSFENLQRLKQYSKEDSSLWKKLKTGVELLLNKLIEKPVVYLLAHHGGKTVSQLVKDIATRCSECFGKTLIPMERVDFISSQGSVDDYGYAIEKYKQKIKEGDVILIANLNEIPARAARALHAICDTHTPIHKNVVLFLTLAVTANGFGNADSIAEGTLRQLWGTDLPPNELDPLITRVTDQVIVLQS